MQEVVRHLLEMRGLSADDADSFLSPSYTNIGDPLTMKDMAKSIERVHDAINKGEKIAIYADYDCDGIPGAVVLSDMFDIIGYTNYIVYIPDRHKEGYGLHIPAIETLVEQGVTLIITIDVGITAVEQAKFCKEKNIDLIITDHHLPLEQIIKNKKTKDSQIIPDAFAVINPKQSGNTYPDDMLCGSGVIFTFVRGFLNAYREEYKVPIGWEKWLLDMVAVATLSDMVPLLKENRVLAYYGLQVLRKTRRPGLQLLLEKAGVDVAHMLEDDVTFTLAPRLNAASRMDTPMTAFKVLKAKSVKEAVSLVVHLESLNTDRKTKVATIMKEVKKKMAALLKEKNTEQVPESVIVIGNPGWNIGVLGLVASKVVDEYGKTTFVWARDESGVIKGSCRSNGTCHLVTIMSAVPTDTFVAYGGHEAAGGFSVTNDAIHTLSERLNSVHHVAIIDNTLEELIEKEKQPLLLSIPAINIAIYKEVQKFAPFGVANEKPVFLLKRVLINSAKEFGKEKNHLEIILEDADRKLKAIAFFKTTNDFEQKLVPGMYIDMQAYIEESRYMGKVELRLRIESIVPVL